MKKIAFVLLLFAIPRANADNHFVPPQVEVAPIIDGVLDEAAWQNALVVSDFVQRLPKEGAQPSERTEVRIFYTRHALYLGFRAYDSRPQSIVSTVRKRDDFDITQNDQFVVAIDSYNDGRNGYWFSTNPLGARVDAQFSDEGDVWVPEWNGIWNCKSRIDAHGWTAEVEIPFNTLHFRKAEVNIMGINLYRRLIRTNEHLFAPLVPLRLPNGTPNVSVARKFEFRGITSGGSAYLKPYGLLGYSQTETNQSQTNGGIDFKYQITSNVTANLSTRMDFAEADVDDRQINLTRFRLFFPEKREFFLENASNFQFGTPGVTEVFFSRRIGLDDESGDPVPIQAAAKLTGKFGIFDIGLLDAQTGKTNFSIPENFGAFRMKAGIGTRSYIGAILTTRDSAETDLLKTYGADMNLHLSHDVFLNGYMAQGELHSDAFSIALLRQGQRTSFHFGYSKIDPDFQPPIGFLQRTDSRRWEGSLFVPGYLQNKWILSLTPGYEFVIDHDHQGNQIEMSHQVSFSTAFQSGDVVRFFANHTETFLLVPLPLFRSINIPSGNFSANRGGVEVTTKDGRPLSADVTFSGSGFYNGTRWEIAPSITWKINSHFTASQSLSENLINLSSNDFSIVLLRSRLSYALNTSLSVSSLLQYDNSSQTFGINFRLSYLFREGTEFIVVYNESLEHQPFGTIGTSNLHSLLVKFTYLLHF